MVTFIFYLFLGYLLYQIVFRFILPVYRTTRQVRKGFREMQERMQGAQRPEAGTTPSSAHVRTGPVKQQGDYIDFEEVKD